MKRRRGASRRETGGTSHSATSRQNPLRSTTRTRTSKSGGQRTLHRHLPRGTKLKLETMRMMSSWYQLPKRKTILLSRSPNRPRRKNQKNSRVMSSLNLRLMSTIHRRRGSPTGTVQAIRLDGGVQVGAEEVMHKTIATTTRQTRISRSLPVANSRLTQTRGHLQTARPVLPPTLEVDGPRSGNELDREWIRRRAIRQWERTSQAGVTRSCCPR